MPIPNPDGCLSTAEDILADALATCSSFQAWLGVSGVSAEADARARIHGAVLDGCAYNAKGEIDRSELERMRPFAMVFVPDGGYVWARAGSSGNIQFPSGVRRLHVSFERDIPQEYREKGKLAWADRDFRNHIGKIAQELFIKCGRQHPYPDINTITLEMSPTFSSPAEQHNIGLAQECLLVVELARG
jgi:hypothetical protein